jgi:DDE superfamily endonuclease
LELQKKTLGATERDEEERSAFRERLRGVDTERLLFVDESSTNVALTPRSGRAPRGERAYGKAPRNWGKNVTLISSIGVEGMGASMSIEGSSETDSFGRYVREILAPTLKSGQIILMDNLSVHTSKWVRELIEERGCQLWVLPSYSPDLNPIDICQPQCAFKHKLSYHWPRRAARTTGVGREARSRPPTQRRGGSAMSSRGAVPPRP